MTPEQRFTKIENVLSSVAEHQAQTAEAHRRHDEEIHELRQMHKGLIVAVGKIAEAQNSLTETQRLTAEKLNAFIEWVKKYLQGRGGNGQQTA